MLKTLIRYFWHFLGNFKFKPLYIPEKTREDFRLISRIRETLIKEKGRKGNQIKNLLYQLGKIPTGPVPRVSALI